MYVQKKKNPNQLFRDPLWQQLDIFMNIFSCSIYKCKYSMYLILYLPFTQKRKTYILYSNFKIYFLFSKNSL